MFILLFWFGFCVKIWIIVCCHLLSAWRFSFGVPCKVGLLVTNPLRFYWLGMSLLHLQFWNTVLLNILVNFFLSTLWVCHLTDLWLSLFLRSQNFECLFIAVNFIVVFLCLVSCFLCYFQMFSFGFGSQHFYYDIFGINSFALILVKVC
jgi:hypothetical protein